MPSRMLTISPRIAGLLLVCAPLLAEQELPNIVIVYADDLGFCDISCYNPKADPILADVSALLDSRPVARFSNRLPTAPCGSPNRPSD